MENNIEQAAIRLEELKGVIKYHCELYYNSDSPEISDTDFDKLTRELRELETAYPQLITEDSYTQMVFGKPDEGTAVAHRNPMLSLQDVFDTDEVEKFVARVLADKEVDEETSFVVEPKIDGLSLSIRYENGKYSLAETRGDGINYGENVTENGKQIIGIPQLLDDKVAYLEVRGEVYMTEANFEIANSIQEENGDKLFKNPRNCAAGTLRQKNASGMAGRQLNFFAFNVQECIGRDFESHFEQLEWLKSQGIAVVDNKPACKTVEEVIKRISEIEESKNSLGYPIDGAVVKVDELSAREQIGTTSKHPRWAIAYKYPPEEKRTIIQDIITQVGRTGRITPVAIFNTIQLAGTDVSRATIHNQDQVDRLGINIGDEIIVRKAAEIIPEILSVFKKNSIGNFVLPTRCPVCGAATVKQECEVTCINPACPAQFELSVAHFASREAMDIDGLGSESVKSLINGGYIKKLEDIYTIKNFRDELVAKKIVGKEKSTDKLLAAIEKSKTNSLARLIKGFGVKNIGKHVGKSLETRFDSLDAIMAATYNDLISIEGMGSVIAQQVVDFFAQAETLVMIENLKAAGVNCESQKEVKLSNKFEGQTFVITGTLSRDRKSIEAEIVANGGKISGSVSKKTTYVLAGDEAGSKLTKAQELGIKVLTEDDYNNM